MKVFLIICGIVVMTYIAYRTYRIATLDKGLSTLVSKGAIILDVRTKGEFEQGHLKSAVNIPLSQLHKGDINIDTSATIITCCSHGLRSVKAVSVLKERGYKKVYNGGAWSDLKESLSQ